MENAAIKIVSKGEAEIIIISIILIIMSVLHEFTVDTDSVIVVVCDVKSRG